VQRRNKPAEPSPAFRLDSEMGDGVSAGVDHRPLSSPNERAPQLPSAAQAAGALRPVAGSLASTLFALGFIGSGMLAVPVLAGAGSVGPAGQLGKPWGLSLSLRKESGTFACASDADWPAADRLAPRRKLSTAGHGPRRSGPDG
jgi:hypothetical protein